MIRQFDMGTALLLIDVQIGVDDLSHWGGVTGRRNNPDAEKKMLDLLIKWRSTGLPVAFTQHDSVESNSPLKLNLPTGRQKLGFEIQSGDIAVTKNVNNGFIGTSLQNDLNACSVNRLVVVGFFTNMCVEATVRMAGNLGYDTYLIPECCATTNRLGPGGVDYDPELIHAITVANLHGEFCTSLNPHVAEGLLSGDNIDLNRVQGNE
ncbi:MAG: isochorismatase family protein [Acidimicrobiales bacterium]|nr:isochorismatase family protein [Acidimicrobiales bacterium]